MRRLLGERGIPAGILQQDDYFVFPPRTNHEMRQRDIEQVGPFEVKLHFMDSNLRSFKRGENPIFKPLVLYDEDRITVEEMDTSDMAVLIAEGTFTSLLTFIDLCVFIDLDYRQTLEGRQRRARAVHELDPFLLDVLEREHQIILKHKSRADVIIPPDLQGIQLISQ
jgi:uridine kinase